MGPPPDYVINPKFLGRVDEVVVTKAAADRGILPIYWDNGGRQSGGENFGLFDRNNNTVLRSKLLEARQRAATHTYGLGDIAKPIASK